MTHININWIHTAKSLCSSLSIYPFRNSIFFEFVLFSKHFHVAIFYGMVAILAQAPSLAAALIFLVQTRPTSETSSGTSENYGCNPKDSYILMIYSPGVYIVPNSLNDIFMHRNTQTLLSP